MKMLITEEQFKSLTVQGTHKGPTVKLYNKDKFDSEDVSAIKKMKNVYNALTKGRGSIQFGNKEYFPAFDVKYELPPLNEVTFIIDHPGDSEFEKKYSTSYKILTPKNSIKFDILNYDEINNMDLVLPLSPKEKYLSMTYELKQLVEKKFKHFNIELG